MIKTPPADPMYDYHALTGRMAAITMEIKASKGELVFCPQVGYRINLDGPRAKGEPDPVLAPLVREAFERYATGEYSIRKLLKVMTECGLVARSGKRIGSFGLHTMLTNPFYCGKVRWGGELIDGGHEVLIANAIFDQVIQRLSQQRSGSNRSNNCVADPDLLQSLDRSSDLSAACAVIESGERCL